VESARTGEAVQGRPEHARRTAQQVHKLRLGQVMASRVQRVDDLGELGAGWAVRWAEEPLRRGSSVGEDVVAAATDDNTALKELSSAPCARCGQNGPLMERRMLVLVVPAQYTFGGNCLKIAQRVHFLSPCPIFLVPREDYESIRQTLAHAGIEGPLAHTGLEGQRTGGVGAV
jgi:hypothetical protein